MKRLIRSSFAFSAVLLASSWALAQSAPPAAPAKPAPAKPAPAKPAPAKPAPAKSPAAEAKPADAAPPTKADAPPDESNAPSDGGQAATEAPSAGGTEAPPVAPAAAPPPMMPQAGSSPYMWGPPGTPVPSTPGPAPVDTAPEEPLPPAGPPGWQLYLGLRTGFHTDSSFDPFAENNAMLQGSLGGSRRLFSSEPLSIAAALSFDGGARTATARGAATKLEAYRLLAGPEVRWHVVPQLYAFARPSLGALRTIASLEEGTTATTLYARNWTVAADLTAGAAFAFADLRRHAGDLRFWVVADGGYGWAASSDLELAPDEGAGPERTASLDLGKLALRGPFFRVAVAATF